jgi:ferredoxin
MATIYTYSATGNSLYAARKIAEKIGGGIVSMNAGSAVCEDDVVGFVFPNYFWGLPRKVARFVSSVRIANKGAYVFAVVTCGGPSFGLLGWLKESLGRNGISLCYGASLISGSNYIPEYEFKDSPEFRQKIERKLAKISAAIANRETNRVSSFSVPNKMVNKYYPDANSDRLFTVSPSCTGCAACQKVCPVNNIEMDNAGGGAGKPVFRHRCEHCLACLHNCPASAIDWKQKTQGKPRYRNPAITLEDLIALNAE